jgi:HNH endonuclease
MPPKLIPLATRFWAKVARGESCWLWLGYCKPNGYGSIGLGGRAEGKDYAHRVAWRLAYGAIPDGLYVCHRCDTPACCRPDHLWLGTHAENLGDMRAKGRGATGDRHGSRTRPDRVARGARSGPARHPESMRWKDTDPRRLDSTVLPRGERKPQAKLTEMAVREMRRRHVAGEMVKTLAAEFGVSRPTASKAVAGRTWAHLG